MPVPARGGLRRGRSTQHVAVQILVGRDEGLQAELAASRGTCLLRQLPAPRLVAGKTQQGVANLGAVAADEDHLAVAEVALIAGPPRDYAGKTGNQRLLQ